MRRAPMAARLRRLAIALCVFAAAATILPVAAGTGLPTLPPVPTPGAVPTPSSPLDPIAPGNAVPPCSFPPLGPTEIRQLAFDYRFGGLSATEPPPEQFSAVDPHHPCRIFAGSGVGISRGEVDRLDPGGIWTPVLQTNSPVNTVWLSAPVVAADGTVIASDRGQGFQANLAPGGIRVSHDEGRSWQRSDSGIPPDFSVTSITVAPSDPREAFAVVWTPSAFFPYSPKPLIFGTHDGLSTWSLLAVHLTQFDNPIVAIDPVDANDVTVMEAASLSTSTDGGLTWTPHPITLPTNGSSCGVVAGHPLGVAVVYVRICTPGRDMWERTFDGGATMLPLNVPQVSGSALAVDGADHQTLLWAAPIVAADGKHWSGTRLITSVDEFQTAAADRVFTNPADWQLPFVNTQYQPPLAEGTNPPIRLHSDANGDFFMDFSDEQYSPRPPYQFDDADHIVAFRLSALADSASGASGSATSGSNGGASGAGSAPAANGFDPAATFVPDLRTCQLPPPPTISPQESYTSGNIAFDGDYLDYTYVYPQDVPAVNGVIYREHTDCSPAPPLHLNAADFPFQLLPVIYYLTYDPRYPIDGARGALIATIQDAVAAARGSVLAGVLYAIDPVTGRSKFLVNAPQNALYSYDPGRDALWMGGYGGGGGLDLTSLSGQALPTCMSSSWLGNSYVTSMLVSASPGIVYDQSEDDNTIFRVDTATCQVTGGFTHRNYSESSGENDQMACDPLTWGQSASGFSALWIKDVNPNTVTSYAIPDGYCPFPTSLVYNGDTRANVGAPVSLCATLTAQRAGRRDELPNEQLSFTLAGQPEGQGTTDSHGRACVPAHAPHTVGAFAVHAVFGGTRAYAPSETDGVLTTLYDHATTVPIAAALVLGSTSSGEAPPPEPLPQPAPVSHAQVAEQGVTQIQSQAQAQAQTQAQTQSVAQVQPGVAVQRQRRTQIATQEQGTGTNVAYEAASLRRGRPAPVTALAAGLMLFGLEVLLRRPRWAQARLHRRRPLRRARAGSPAQEPQRH